MGKRAGEVGDLKGAATLSGKGEPSIAVAILTVQERGTGGRECIVEGNGSGRFKFWVVSALHGVL
jgi:hypothetical protein